MLLYYGDQSLACRQRECSVFKVLSMSADYESLPLHWLIIVASNREEMMSVPCFIANERLIRIKKEEEENSMLNRKVEMNEIRNQILHNVSHAFTSMTDGKENHIFDHYWSSFMRKLVFRCISRERFHQPRSPCRWEGFDLLAIENHIHLWVMRGMRVSCWRLRHSYPYHGARQRS